jgi:(2Fe-2S) ferredoxin
LSQHDRLRQRAAKKQLTTMDRHVLVCVDDDCDEKGKLIKHLKQAINAAGLRVSVTTTKVKCFGICKAGPIMVVYPEGTWYADVTTKAADRIVTEHLRDGRPVAECAFLRNPLCAGAAMAASA